MVKYKLTNNSETISKIDDNGGITTLAIFKKKLSKNLIKEKKEFDDWIADSNTPQEYETPEDKQRIEDDKFLVMREKRNNLLTESDCYIIEDHSTDKKSEWLKYRQVLRNLPEIIDINDFNYPLKPE